MKIGQNNDNLIEVLNDVADSFVNKRNVINPKDVTRPIISKVPFPLETVVELEKKTHEDQAEFIVKRLNELCYDNITLITLIKRAKEGSHGSIESSYIELAKRVKLI